MSSRSFSFGNSGNPLAQVLSALVFAVVLVGALIMGAFLLVALIGLAVIGFLGLQLYAWWRRRKSRGRGPNGGAGPGRPAKGIRYIEGEYEVIDADADAERRRSGERR
jgi:uncharacterized iron-regulated membrane protein